MRCGARDWLWCPGGWELTRLEALEVSGVDYEDPNSVLKSLPASLGQLGSLKQLTLVGLGALKVLTEAVVSTDLAGQLDDST